MKTKFTILLAALTIAALAQIATVIQPLREITIQTNASTNLNASSIRMTIGEVFLDPTNYVPVLRINIEAWTTEVDPAGATNSVLIDRRMLVTTPTQMKNWYQAANGSNFIKAALLNKVGLTEKQ